MYTCIFSRLILYYAIKNISYIFRSSLPAYDSPYWTREPSDRQHHFNAPGHYYFIIMAFDTNITLITDLLGSWQIFAQHKTALKSQLHNQSLCVSCGPCFAIITKQLPVMAKSTWVFDDALRNEKKYDIKQLEQFMSFLWSILVFTCSFSGK